MASANRSLTVRGLSKHFGGVVAVDTFSLEASADRITGIIGPNGAGKTTVFNMLSGLVRPDQGEISLSGESIGGLPSYRVAQLGVQRTFQNIRLFRGLSVLDNVAVAVVRQRGTTLRDARKTAKRLLEEVGFQASPKMLPAELPYAFQRRVEIARALGAEPRVLLLDEPAAGMDRRERDELVVLVETVKQRGVVVLLVEHDTALVSRLCDDVVVMDFGRVIATGAPEEIRADPVVIEAYLGKDS